MNLPHSLFSFLAVSALAILAGCSSVSDEPVSKPMQQFEPTWDSIRQHEAPEWFHDAKFGIFIHWGLYSVPAWATPKGELGQVDVDVWFANNPYAEWYMNTLRIEGSPTQEHHYKTYGKEFDYYDFTPKFNEAVQRWDPNQMAELFKEVGAQYVVLTTKHHDGFTLWPSDVTNPNQPADRQGSSRDLVGELTEAVRARGLTMGLYYSGGLDWSFNPKPVTTIQDVWGTIIHTEEYAKYADAHWRELIDRYQPTILWNDIGYPRQGDLKQIVADFYNRYPEGVINDRWGTRAPEFVMGERPEGAEPLEPEAHHDYVTPEYAKMKKITPFKWETVRGLGYSFGYNQVEGEEETIKEDELIHLLVDIVSKNGNLLLNVGPKPDGSIPEIQADRLRALGNWLNVNGEAIYGTRPWERAEGNTAQGLDVRFTRKGETLYVFLLGDPAGAEVTIESLNVPAGSAVNLLGASGSLAHRTENNSFIVTLPEARPESHAYVLKVEAGA
jgi:alpha-L-fucosidase